MLKEKITYDQQITEDGIIHIRKITRIIKDDKELTKLYHRHVLTPGDNVDNEDDKTKLIANVIYTPEFVTAYKKKMKEQETENLK